MNLALKITQPLVDTFQNKLRRRLLKKFQPHRELHFQKGRFEVRTAQTAQDLERVLAFRSDVFHREGLGVAAPGGLDLERFDLMADHLMVIDQITNEVVGTYRMISSDWASEYYSQSEFELGPLLDLPGRKLELGRACVHRGFRDGVIVGLLWRGVAQYAKLIESDWIFGCASFDTEDSIEASALYRHFVAHALFERAHLRTLPKFSVEGLETDTHESSFPQNQLPPLVKAYLNAGCRVASGPAWDRDFKCMDFLMVLEVKRVNRLVEKRFFGEAVIDRV